MEAAVFAAVALEPGNIFLQNDNDAAQSVTTPRRQKDPRGRTKRAHLAETPAAVRVTHIRGDSITVTVARNALGEAVVPRGTAVTLTATDSRLATTKKVRQKKSGAATAVCSHRCRLVCYHTPALSSETVAVGPRRVIDSSRRAIAAVAAQQGVIAEGLRLTHVAGRRHRLRWADALSRHLVAQAAAALTRCGRERGDVWRNVCKQTAEGGTLTWNVAHVCSRGSRSIP